MPTWKLKVPPAKEKGRGLSFCCAATSRKIAVLLRWDSAFVILLLPEQHLRKILQQNVAACCGSEGACGLNRQRAIWCLVTQAKGGALCLVSKPHGIVDIYSRWGAALFWGGGVWCS